VKDIISSIRGNYMVHGDHKEEQDQRIMESSVAITTR